MVNYLNRSSYVAEDGRAISGYKRWGSMGERQPKRFQQFSRRHS